MATAQETFDTVVNHLRQQGKRAVDPTLGGTCLYRAPDGSKCAVGILIKDEEYFPSMELLGTVRHLLKNDFVLPPLRKRLGEHLSLLIALQDIHDGARDLTGQVLMNEWELRFQLLAEERKLVYTPPQTSARE